MVFFQSFADSAIAQDNRTYSTDACAVYAELEAYMTSRSTDELREIGRALEATPDDLDAVKMRSITGLSEEASAFLYDSDEDQAMATMFLGAGFLKTHHPVLIEEYLAGEHEANGNPGGDEGAATAAAFFDMVIAGALETYQADCLAQ